MTAADCVCDCKSLSSSSLFSSLVVCSDVARASGGAGRNENTTPAQWPVQHSKHAAVSGGGGSHTATDTQARTFVALLTCLWAVGVNHLVHKGKLLAH